tara:strand:- start:192 stop:4256 length:4065 start_codon:yes stop_codon:yes gene_type:complete
MAETEVKEVEEKIEDETSVDETVEDEVIDVEIESDKIPRSLQGSLVNTDLPPSLQNSVVTQRFKPGTKNPFFARPQKKTRRTLREYFTSIKESFVGEEFEFLRYLERGFGKTNINLALQFHSDGELGFDYKDAFDYEPEDTGILERFLESGAALVGDIPTFVAGAKIGGPFGIFTGAVLNETIKSMYLAALDDGEVDDFQDFWRLFIEEGVLVEALKEGTKSGVILSSTLGASRFLKAAGFKGDLKVGLPGDKVRTRGRQRQLTIPGKARDFAQDTLAQVATFNAMGAVLSDQVPTKESIINDFLLFGTLGFTTQGSNVARKLQIQDNYTGPKIVKKIQQNPLYNQAVYSLNAQLNKGKVEYGPNQSPYQYHKSKLIRNLTGETMSPKQLRENLGLPENTVSKMIQFGKQDSITLPKKWQKFKGDFMEAMVDRLYPVKQLVDKLDKIAREKGDIFGPLNPYEVGRTLQSSYQRSLSFFENGPVKFESLKRTGGEGLNKILETITKETVKGEGIVDTALGIKQKLIPRRDTKAVAKEMAELNLYLAAKRLIEKYKEVLGKETPLLQKQLQQQGFSPKAYTEAQQMVRQYAGKYEKIAQKLRRYNKELLDYLQDSGIIGKKDRLLIEQANKDFTPFNTLPEGPVKGVKWWTGFDPKNTMIQDPITSMYRNTIIYVNLAEKNRAMRLFFEMIENNPKATPEVKRVKTERKELTKQEMEELWSNYGKKKDMPEGIDIFRENGMFSEIFTAEKKLAPRQTISYLKDGKKTTYEVTDVSLYRALADQNRLSMGILRDVIKPFQFATKTLRTGATLTPEFFVANLIRDGLSSAVISKNYHVPFYHTGTGFIELFKDFRSRRKGQGSTEIMERYLVSGGGQANFLEMNKNYFESNLIKEFQHDKFVNTVPRNLAGQVMDFLNRAGSWGENAARIGEFKKTYQNLQRGLYDRPPGSAKMSQREILERAGFEARDLIDFAKGGSVALAYNSVSAFFNARIRGYDKLITAFKDRPAKTFTGFAMTVTLPSLALFYVNYDDPEYTALPRWRKDLFWNIPLHKSGFTDEPTFLSIPKPWEAGLMFGTSVERLGEWLVKEEGEAEAMDNFFIDVFLKDVRTGILPLPTLATPFVDVGSNMSWFTGRPIIPEQKKKNLFSEYQYDRNTSELSKFITGRLNPLLREIGMDGPAPANIDYVITSWTGGLGRNLLKLSNAIIKGIDTDEKVYDIWSSDWIKNVNDIPIVKAFFVRNPTMTSQHISDFYKNLELARKTAGTVNLLEEEQKIYELEQFMQTPEYLFYQDMTKVGTSISELRELIDVVYNAPETELTDDEKRDLVDKLTRAIIRLSQGANQIANEYRKGLEKTKN